MIESPVVSSLPIEYTRRIYSVLLAVSIAMTNRPAENYCQSRQQKIKLQLTFKICTWFINPAIAPASIKQHKIIPEAHPPMYPWHGPNNHPSNAPPPGPHGPPAPPSTSPSFAVQQPLRWLPAVVSRQQNTQPAAVPSNLRMGLARTPDHGHHQQHQQHQPQPPPPPPPGVNMTAENPPESVDSSDMEQSDSSPGNNGRDAPAAAMGSMGADSEYTTQQRQPAGPHVRSTTEAGAVGPLPNPLMRPEGGRPSIGEVEIEGSVAGGGEDSGSRKHGKRLTTKEEVTLFEICNRHAHGFGQRSNLCKWWATVTEEFTRAHGHPYSWHSVRRKVETVTKQRMKFLEEHRDKGGVSEDLSNPQWRATIDAWIPTWKRWEESEAKRIERRDSRKSRKRKSRSWEALDSVSDGWSQSASPTVSAATATRPPPLPPSSSSSLSTTTPAVRLPPGFDSMFPNPPPQTPTSRAGGNPLSSQNTYQMSPSSSTPGMDSHVMTAMLDTLNKLNKRLDSTPAAPPANPRASPVISALVSTSEPPPPPPPSQPSPKQTQEDPAASASVSQDAISISKLKEELRQEILTEMRRELEKDRAGLEERLDSVQRTQDMILEMLRQEPT